MKRRFTPVRLTAVQTQLFHSRQQAAGETVEQFTQELQKLFNQAYARAARGGTEAEKLARTQLANQFVTGLRPEFKRKLIGVEGSLEELILKARFEEAKGRELALETSHAAAGAKLSVPHTTPTRPPPPAAPTTQGPSVLSPKTSGPETSGPSRASRGRCFSCGLEGHMARNCPYRKSRRDEEARG